VEERGDLPMERNSNQVYTTGLNQALEFLNAKGDVGETEQILEQEIASQEGKPERQDEEDDLT
jgi:hypothetical protein